MRLCHASPADKGKRMYVSLLRLYIEISQQSPLLFVGLIVLLMASWGLIVGALSEIVIRLFDVRD
jgi:hypothetical protein